MTYYSRTYSLMKVGEILCVNQMLEYLSMTLNVSKVVAFATMTRYEVLLVLRFFIQLFISSWFYQCKSSFTYDHTKGKTVKLLNQ